METSNIDQNLWSGSELELLVILLEYEKEFGTWEQIKQHIVDDDQGGRSCARCWYLLYSHDGGYQRLRNRALARSSEFDRGDKYTGLWQGKTVYYSEEDVVCIPF